MNATDIDEDDSIKYRILHVSNNGKRTFYVNPTTGDVEVCEINNKEREKNSPTFLGSWKCPSRPELFNHHHGNRCKRCLKPEHP